MAKTFALYLILAMAFVATVGLSAYLGTRQVVQQPAPVAEQPGDTSSPEVVNTQDGMEIVVSNPAEGAVLTTISIVVRGKTEASADVAINEIDTVADNKGNFQATLNLEEGVNTISILVSNALGQEAEKTVLVTVSL